MPVYDYRCDDCGPFSRLAPMAAAKEPAICPECGKTALRIISAPFLACTTPGNRKAWERNEKAAHEPKIKRGGCGCSSGAHTCGAKSANTSLQKSNKRNSRPWMLGH